MTRLLLGFTQRRKIPTSFAIALILSATGASAKDRLDASFSWTQDQLLQLQFSPKSYQQNRVGLIFSDPRRAGEIEKILFDATFKPKKRPLEADFIVETIIKSTKTKREIGESASCDWNDNKSAAECWVEDDGGAFKIIASWRARDSKSAVLNFVIQPNSEYKIFRIAAEKAFKVEVSTSGPVVESPITFR
ncbi:MAG TPA: hypothetical protein VLU23_15405 [Pseudolabrys sp.]|nr:hypothetical protein [Pseudolabrys sp.]